MSEDCFHRILVMGQNVKSVARFVAEVVTAEGHLTGSRPQQPPVEIEEVSHVVFESETDAGQRDVYRSLPARLPKRFIETRSARADIGYFLHVVLLGGPVSPHLGASIVRRGGIGPSEYFSNYFDRFPDLYYFCGLLLYESGYAQWELWKGGRRVRYGFDVRASLDDHQRFAEVVARWTGFHLAEPDEDDWASELQIDP
jgi:hypothetical protein